MRDAFVAAGEFRSTLATPAALTVQGALARVFAENTCPLPRKLRDALKDAAKRPSGQWIPDDLRRTLSTGTLAKEVGQVNFTTVARVLHDISLVDAKGTTNAQVEGTSTVLHFDVLSMVDPSRLHVMYSYDCSGLLGATASLNANYAVADLKTAATSSLTTKTALVAVVASLFSPLAVALTPDLMPIERPKREQMELLHAILAEAAQRQAKDDTQVYAPKELDLVWTSNSGNSSFQGKADLSAGASGSVFFFSASATGTASGTVNRGVEFASFETYVLPNDSLTKVHAEVGAIRGGLVRLVHDAATISAVKTINASYETTLDLPANVCLHHNWAMAPLQGKPEEVQGPVTPAWTASGCVFTATPQEGKATVATQKGFKIVSEKVFGSPQAFEIEIHMP